MATRHRIDNALTNIQTGDVEKYFNELSNIIENNSGTHDCKMISHDCNNTAVPVHAGQFTRFKLTDHAMDVVDISKGYIMMKLEMDINFDYGEWQSSNTNVYPNRPWYFVGFKSSSHIVEIYNVYSNGVLTACKQTKAKHEQAIVYNSKAKEERVGRPGMYSTHDKVKEMSDCVCGVYVRSPLAADKSKTVTVTFDVVIQVDDLLPFSAFEYFPRFMCGELELEISASLHNNMVFCQLPLELTEATIDPHGEEYDYITSFDAYLNRSRFDRLTDMRFTQCGDYIEGMCSYTMHMYSSSDNLGSNEATMDGKMKAKEGVYPMTIRTNNLVIREAKSYIHGFNIKSEAKQNILNMFSGKNLVIPAQWVDHFTFSQLPTTNSIRTNIQTALFNATQVILTFPNSANQLTVSRNPHLESIQCQIADKIIPDKFFSTLDKAHAEMIISNLNMDSLFSAPDELIEALTKDRGTNGSWTLKKIDDSDYQLVFNLERFGNGCFCDGLTGNPVPINFQANFMNGTHNPHYYDKSGKLLQQNVNLFVVSDAFWVCNRNGCQFIKDVSTQY